MKTDNVHAMALAELPQPDAQTAASVLRGIHQMQMTHGHSWDYEPSLKGLPKNIANWIRAKLKPAAPAGDQTFPPARLLSDQNATVVSSGPYTSHANEIDAANEIVEMIGPTVKAKYQ